MSSYVVQDKTINRVVAWMEHEDNRAGWLGRVLKAQANLDPRCDGWEIVGQAMFNANVAAVEQRYDEGEAATFRPLDYEHHYVAGTAIDAYKALQCWLYQCAEGNVPEQPLYQLLKQDVLPAIADRIIRELPAYEKATWG